MISVIVEVRPGSPRPRLRLAEITREGQTASLSRSKLRAVCPRLEWRTTDGHTSTLVSACRSPRQPEITPPSFVTQTSRFTIHRADGRLVLNPHPTLRRETALYF